MAESVHWPVKQREVRVGGDSSRWNDFGFREGDIVIASPPKTGTTLTQQIVGQLIFGGDAEMFAQSVSPWIDAVTIMPQALEMAEVQTHRRFMKTHLPIDALVYSPIARYIFVARDARDVVWANYNHMNNFTPAARERLRVAGANLPDKLSDIRTFYNAFMAGHSPMADMFWNQVKGWWEYRHLPNLLLVHFANLVSDKRGSVRRIAGFLDIELSDELLDKVVRFTSIEHMKKVAADSEHLKRQFVGGSETFINKGTNGRWREVLSEEEIALCDKVAAERLPSDCAHWLRTGELPDD